MALADMVAKASQLQAQTAEISFPDEVVVYPPVYGRDAVGGPTQEAGAGITMACKIARAASKSTNARLVNNDHLGTAFGQHQFIITFPTDPGITAAETILKVTKDSLGNALSRRPILVTVGAAEWPVGGDPAYYVFAIWHDGFEDASASPPSPGPDGIPDPGPVETPDPGTADTTFSIAAGTYLMNNGSSVAYPGGTVPIVGDKTLYVWLDAKGNLFTT